MDGYGYGLWFLVILNSAIFIIFALSFFHPKTTRDWRAMGAFSAFVVALFTEMFGFPLTIYLLSGWLGDRVPALTLTHSGGHLWNDLIGWPFDPHISPFHLLSYVFLIGGFMLIANAWKVLWEAQRGNELATSGPYAYVRHPQYTGFILVMVGFLLQWPTIPTLVMFPVLLLVYRRLAVNEEREVASRFGRAWETYATVTPRFFTKPSRVRSAQSSAASPGGAGPLAGGSHPATHHDAAA